MCLTRNPPVLTASDSSKEGRRAGKDDSKCLIECHSGNKCKAGFPLDSRMHLKEPLLLCKGLAKQMSLPFKGRRIVLGQVLGRRTSPWLDGTAPGMAVALPGSNTDVQVNDLRPIAQLSHESHAYANHCIPKAMGKRQRAVRRLIQRVARTQTQRNGYFGGYICKRQT